MNGGQESKKEKTLRKEEKKWERAVFLNRPLALPPAPPLSDPLPSPPAPVLFINKHIR